MKRLQTITFILVLSLFSTLSTISAQCDPDTIPPSTFTVDLSTAVLDESYTVKLYAIDFIYIKSDNCTPADSLRFTFSPTAPENDYKYKEEFRSSTMIYDCYDAANSPILISIYSWDLAGNSTNQSVNLTIVSNLTPGCEGCEMDTTPPEAQTHEGITWVLLPNTECTEIWASDFASSATDNCTADELIKHSFTAVSPWDDPSSGFLCLDCDDVMNSPISVDIYSWDKSGNYTINTSQAYIQNQNGEDCTMDSILITGTVVSLKGGPIVGADVYLENDLGQIIDGTSTNDSGEYSFFTNPADKYLSVEFIDESEPELSVLDLGGIQKFMLGLDSFSSAQKLAADINADGRIRVNDLKMLRKIVLGITEPGTNLDKEWHFIKQDQDVNDSMEDIRIALDGSQGPTIVGYRMGDVK